MERLFPGISVSSGTIGSGRLVNRIALAALFLCAYVALERISFIHEYKGVPITPWNPGLGAVFALMMLGGPSYAAVLFVGVVIAETLVLGTTLSWPAICGIAIIIAVVYGVAATITAKLKLDTTLFHLKDVLLLLFAGACGAALATILLLSAMVVLDPALEWADALTALLPLFVGDTIGIAVVTPLLLRLIHGRNGALLKLESLAELTFYSVLIAASLWIIANAGITSGIKFFYLLFVPVVLAAVRFGLDGACISLALAQLGLVGALQFFNADAKTFTDFQVLMLVLTATGLIVGVVVTERESANLLTRDAERRLKEKEAEAAQASRFTLVSGMASALAHEINQPMTAARALARSAQELLRRPDADIARADNNLSTMIVQVDHAGAIVRRMRDFLRRGHPRVSTVDAGAVLDDALILASAEAAANKIAIRLDKAANLPIIYGDRVQLQQVALNLIRNSIDAITGAKIARGEIALAARHLHAPERIEFSVADNGPGVDHAIADKLFEPLMTSKHEGLGLGLPISASIVEAHGGKFWLHSGAPGATEFRFTIPVEAKAMD